MLSLLAETVWLCSGDDAGGATAGAGEGAGAGADWLCSCDDMLAVREMSAQDVLKETLEYSIQFWKHSLKGNVFFPSLQLRQGF